MAGQLKLRRGTTSQLANYIGSEGELTYNTALKSLVLHDGVTLGGVKIPYLSNDLVPSTMLPTATESVVGASKIATTAIAQAGVNDTDFITAKKLRDAFKSPLLGLNQKWVNKTTSRVANTSYQNNTGKNLYFAGSGANEVSGQVSQDGVTWVAQFYLGRAGTVSGGGVGIVPSQWFYRISGGFSTWWEMEDV